MLPCSCRYDEFGRLKRKYREGGAAEDRRAKEAAALARLHGGSGVSPPSSVSSLLLVQGVMPHVFMLDVLLDSGA